MSPNETLFIGSNSALLRDVVHNSPFVHFEIYDFPGHLDFADHEYNKESILKTCTSLIFVIDAQVNAIIYILLYDY